MNATEIKAKIINRTGSRRETEILIAANNGFIPNFMKPENFTKITLTRGTDTLEYFVCNEYFSVGTDDDYLVMPCSPKTLLGLLESLDCSLPTPMMVTQIYQNANFKIPAKPQRPVPGESITSTRLMVSIDDAIKVERTKKSISTNVLVAGHKKDVVLTNTLMRKENKGNVAIFGWYYSDGKRIQGLNPKDHTVDYVDYSHGLRFVHNKCKLNGVDTTLQAIYAHPVHCLFLHDEPLRFLTY